MNVITWGKIPPDPKEFWATVECGNCKTKFEFQKKETKSGGRPGDMPESYIECPLCGQHVIVTDYDFFPRKDKKEVAGA